MRGVPIEYSGLMRPLRIELENALYHVTSRGDRCDQIFRSDSDRMTWLSLLGTTCGRFNFKVWAYCQMTNHYHLLVETVDGKLNRGMRHLNGTFAQYFNRAHGHVGHVFQGRYKAILCQSDLYLQEVSRYIELNPVRAGMVEQPSEWPWSSFNAKLGTISAPAWLESEAVLACFGQSQGAARQAYARFVFEGIGKPSPFSQVRHQLVLGDEPFQAELTEARPAGDLVEIKRSHRQAVTLPLKEYFVRGRAPKEAMALAYHSLSYSMPEIARFAGVSVKTVSRAISEFKTRKEE